jgi:hypothetical protein
MMIFECLFVIPSIKELPLESKIDWEWFGLDDLTKYMIQKQTFLKLIFEAWILSNVFIRPFRSNFPVISYRIEYKRIYVFTSNKLQILYAASLDFISKASFAPVTLKHNLYCKFPFPETISSKNERQMVRRPGLNSIGQSLFSKESYNLCSADNRKT